jgi:hypothetical protein
VLKKEDRGAREAFPFAHPVGRPTPHVFGVLVAGTETARLAGRFRRWLLAQRIEEVQGPEAKEGQEQHAWWKVVCLTGVDYFSTLAYIPGIAALASGALSPITTMLIVLLTLFGMLPSYRRVAAASPHGQGSIAMLEELLSFWKGKLFVLFLLGFVATAWLFTITLSASSATEQVVGNPFVPDLLRDREVTLTLVLVAILGGVFLKGFREAIGIAIFLVGAYLLLNLIIVVVGFYEIAANPATLADWTSALFTDYPGPLAVLGISVLVFPQLALGLSGFETGVSMMPLVRGAEDDDPLRPEGRIRNTRKMLTACALIMCFYLLAISLATTLLIPHERLEPGGEAYGRALAYLAHTRLGDAFGTAYDLSTLAILWFAGASAMAGLLNIVPRYLPRYGMAPEWGRAVRPLVLVYTAVSLAIVVFFEASTTAQAAPYATGVLAMMTAAAIAVTLSVRGAASPAALGFGLVAVVALYATVANVVAQPMGIVIALISIAAIVAVSLVSRVQRSTELRQERIEVDEAAQRYIEEAGEHIHLVAHRRRHGTEEEYSRKEREQREDNHIPPGESIIFLEVQVEDASEFEDVLEVRGVEIGGHKVLRAQSSVVPNAIAAFLLHIRDTTGKTPHCYFGWTEGNPIVYLFRFLLLGEGDTAPVTHEVLREAEPDPEKRPAIHVGGR